MSWRSGLDVSNGDIAPSLKRIRLLLLLLGNTQNPIGLEVLAVRISPRNMHTLQLLLVLVQKWLRTAQSLPWAVRAATTLRWIGYAPLIPAFLPYFPLR